MPLLNSLTKMSEVLLVPPSERRELTGKEFQLMLLHQRHLRDLLSN
jgi:hypothetical protein